MRVLKLIVLAGAIAISVGCSSASEAERVLSAAGYTEITTDGYAWFSCSEDDFIATKFKAKGPTGKPISGVVCSSWLKNATIRID